MRIIAIANQKGGAGKTTTCVNLAAALGEQGKRVLVLDFDPQGAATTWLQGPENSRAPYAVLCERQSFLSEIVQTDVPGVSLFPSSVWLATAEQELPEMAGNRVASREALRTALEALPAGVFDYVLVDCLPSLGLLVVNALIAAGEIIIPVAAQVATLKGLSDLLHTVREIERAGLNRNLRVAGYVACRVDMRARHPGEVVELLREKFGGEVFTTVIRENVRLAESVGFQQPITIHDGRSSGAADYRALALEIIAQEQRGSHGKK